MSTPDAPLEPVAAAGAAEAAPAEALGGADARPAEGRWTVAGATFGGGRMTLDAFPAP